VRQAIIDADMKILEADLQYIPNSHILVEDAEVASKIMKIMDVLEDLDDVVAVHTNADITAGIA
jgi:transcriptional/translational regulatory protein YebC/TACO1